MTLNEEFTANIMIQGQAIIQNPKLKRSKHSLRTEGYKAQHRQDIECTSPSLPPGTSALPATSAMNKVGISPIKALKTES